MAKVFIGGSRQVSHLAVEVQRRVDRIIQQGFPVLVGDANGADRAVQEYLQSRGYDRVEVFCTNGECRNKLGNWPVRAVPAPRGRKDFDYYAAKDKRMAEEASVGLMIWDGESRGTLSNVFRLVNQHKKVVVYMALSKEFVTVRSVSDWERFLAHCGKCVPHRIDQYAAAEAAESQKGTGGI